MKNYVLTLALLFLITFTHAQTITSAQLKLSSDSKRIRFIELVLDNGYTIGVEDCQEIAYVKPPHSNMTLNSLDDLDLDVDYYDRYDIHDPQGKIKSIGKIEFKYNNVFDIHDVFGTLKSIGDINIKYNNTFDIHDSKGTVKSVGDVRIKYYDAFGPEDRFGEIESIKGNNEFLSVAGPLKKRGRFGY